MIAENVKRELLTQIRRYLNNELTKDQYADIAEPYFTEYAEHIEDSQFYRVFESIIPDTCIIYIEEPGLAEEEKDKQFRKQLERAYLELKDL